MRVRLVVPQESRRAPQIHGEHLAYHNREGDFLAAAGNGGAWVMFDPPKYVGCPLDWLEPVDDSDLRRV